MPVLELSAEHTIWLTRMENHLGTERYSRNGRERVSMAKRFLGYLQKNGLNVDTVQPSHVTKYLRRLKRLRHSSRCRDLSDGQRRCHQTALRMLLRLVHGKWPPDPIPQTDRERFYYKLIEGYNAWMRDLRGLHPKTRGRQCTSALRFLQWLGERGSEEALGALVIEDVDMYVQWRMRSLQRRATKKGCAVHLRSFLRYLHGSGRTQDLARSVLLPRLYVHEGVPSALRPEEIKQVLRSARQDRSPIGLRDFAILTLLSTYGLRAGEITALRLDDIDWTHDRLRIHHSKTSVHSELPLLRVPGETILEYLRKGRPKSAEREVFLRACAPYRALRAGSLYSVLEPRLKAAGVAPRGKRGPHAWRHAKAAALLQQAVPLKVIGDVFAHRSVASTMAYLKLDVEQLRGIALELPGARP
jgi:integrase/recombinase XerD